MQKPEWYIEQIAKLEAIMEQGIEEEHYNIHRSYVIEKLKRILNDTGISIHPSLDQPVNKILEDLK